MSVSFVIDKTRTSLAALAHDMGPGWASGAHRTAQGKDFKLILILDKGDHLAVSFGICNHCEVITA